MQYNINQILITCRVTEVPLSGIFIKVAQSEGYHDYFRINDSLCIISQY